MFRQMSRCAVIAAIRSPAASRPDGLALLAGPGAEGGQAAARAAFAGNIKADQSWMVPTVS